MSDLLDLDENAIRDRMANTAAAMIRNASPAIAIALADVLLAIAAHPSIADAIRHAPAGVAAIGRVLAIGGERLGVVGSAADRDVFDHAAAARRHMKRSFGSDDGTLARDTGEGGTGELHLTCAAARAVLAVDGIDRAAGKGGGQ